MHVRKTILAASLCCISAAAAAQQTSSLNASVPTGSQLTNDTSFHATNSGTPQIDANYVIGSQDTLNVDVFGVPDLSGTVVVDNAGAISLPLVGQIHAAGRTTNELSHNIAAALDTRFVRHPVVTVTVKDAASQKVTVDGEVTQPGVYEITPHTTLTQAVALAHGPTNVADTGHVAIVRASPAGRTISVYDLGDIHDGKQVDPYIRANDEVVVDVSGSRRFVRDFGAAFSLAWMLRP